MTAISPPYGFPDDFAGERYIVLAKIGAGGMGETVRAWDKHDGRLVAIKRPKATLVETPGFLERFDREVRMLQRMWHPNVVPITDIGTMRGLPFFAMPFLPGGSLSTRRLRDEHGNPLANQAGMLHLWLPAMAAALDHLHSQGVVHRDVKPANIFFDVYWQAFLGDFGVAKVVDETGAVEREETLTGTNTAMGTEFYMAPEMFSPKPTLSAGIDQYALAVTVYELLAGRRPFTGETAHLIVEVTTQSPPPLNRLRPDLPASLVQAVHRGLSKQVAGRFASCTEFCQTALADVPLLEAERGVARLACPNCAHIIRISTGDAGRMGKCPKCGKRLVIAEDLSGLWTRAEQEIVSAHLTGQPITASDGELHPEAPVNEGGFDFKPLSKSTPVLTKPHSKRLPLHVVTIAAVAISLVGLGALIWQLWPRSAWVIDRASRVAIDEGRLVAFSPKGFRRSSKSSKYLVEYTHRGPGRTPRIRIFSGAEVARGTKTIQVGGRRANMWTQAAERIPGLSGNPIATSCSLDVGGNEYTVEVVATVSQAKDAERLCTLVASALEASGPGIERNPPRPQGPHEGSGLNVEYFVDRDLKKKIDYPDKIDAADIQFDWLGGPPVNGLPADGFSIRWSGFFIPDFTGRHRFVGNRDDGLRIRVNDQLVLDDWNDGSADFVSDAIFLNKGKPYPIKIEYYERHGDAHLTVKVKGEAGEAKVLGSGQLRPSL